MQSGTEDLRDLEKIAVFKDFDVGAIDPFFNAKNLEPICEDFIESDPTTPSVRSALSNVTGDALDNDERLCAKRLFTSTWRTLTPKL